MTESMPPTPDEGRQLYRGLTEKVLDRAESDPTWKQQLLDDPEAAMRAANFPELGRFEEMRQSAGAPWEAEVVGHIKPDPYAYSVWYVCCPFYTLKQTVGP